MAYANLSVIRPSTALRRVGLFVDVQNIYHSVQNSLGRQCKIDYKALMEFARRRGFLQVAKMFKAYNPEQQNEVNFFVAMHHIGYEVIREPLKSYMGEEGEKRGDLDALIGYHIGLEAQNLDEIILVSGDGDFATVVKHLRYAGKHVTVIGVRNCTNNNLIIESSEFVSALDVPGFIVRREGSSSEIMLPDQAGFPDSSTSNGFDNCSARGNHVEKNFAEINHRS